MFWIRAILVAIGAIFFIGGFPWIRYRARLAMWAQARMERGGHDGPGPFAVLQITPSTELAVGIVFLALGGSVLLFGIFGPLS